MCGYSRLSFYGVHTNKALPPRLRAARTAHARSRVHTAERRHTLTRLQNVRHARWRPRARRGGGDAIENICPAAHRTLASSVLPSTQSTGARSCRRYAAACCVLRSAGRRSAGGWWRALASAIPLNAPFLVPVSREPRAASRDTGRDAAARAPPRAAGALSPDHQATGSCGRGAGARKETREQKRVEGKGARRERDE